MVVALAVGNNVLFRKIAGLTTAIGQGKTFIMAGKNQNTVSISRGVICWFSAMENMGFKTYGFAAGRADDWEPDMVYWGLKSKC